MKNLSVVTLNYNSHKYFRRMIESCQEHLSSIPFEIIIVDNASKLESIDELKTIIKEFPSLDIKLIFNKKNGGYSIGNNIGAREAKGEYLYFLNNDAFLANDGLLKDIGYIEENKMVGAIGSRLNFASKFVKLKVAFHDKTFNLYSDVEIKIPVAGIRKLYDKIIVKNGFILDKTTLTINSTYADFGEVWIPVESFFNGKSLSEIEIEFAGDTERVDFISIGDKKYQVEEQTTLGLQKFALSDDLNTFDVIQNRGNYIDYRGSSGDIGFFQDASKFDEAEDYEVQKSVCGGSILISKSLFLTVGGFEETYFAYYEDVDLNLKVRARGFQVILSPNSLVYHHHAGSFVEFSPFFTYNVYFSFMVFIFRLCTWPQIAYNLLNQFRELWRQPNITLFKAAASGYLKGVLFSPKLLWQRKKLSIKNKFLLFGKNTEFFYQKDYKDGSEELISVFNPHLRVLGGGEKSTIDFADYFADRYPDKRIILFTHEKGYPTLKKMYQQFGGSPPGNVHLMSLPTYKAAIERNIHNEEWADLIANYMTLRRFTRKCHIFMNHSARSFFPANATINYCLVMYPFAGQTGEKKQRESQRRMIKWINKTYDVFLGNSEFTIKDTKKYWNPEKPCKVIYPYFEPYIKKDQDPEQFEHEVIAKKDTKKVHNIITIGRFSCQTHSKNQHLLLRAFSQLRRERDDVKLTMIGGAEKGNHIDEEYYRMLQEYADSKKLDVTFIPDCERSELEEQLMLSDIFWSGTGFSTGQPVQNFQKEHFGIVVIEAMHYGVVPFAYDDAGPSETIENGVSGFRVSTISNLVKVTIDYLNKSPELKENHCVNAIRRSRRYRHESFVKRLDQALEVN